jgi:hypothetical protein
MRAIKVWLALEMLINCIYNPFPGGGSILRKMVSNIFKLPYISCKRRRRVGSIFNLAISYNAS